jgi:serine/threonine protein kinase
MATQTPDVAALEAGHSIFEYRIDRVLGGGGFGITYLAQDVNLQLPVAIKEYFPSGVAVRATDKSVQVRSSEGQDQFDWGLDRFIEEARALASFRHPNIVRVLRYFKENGTAYIVMEYESGDPLKYWLRKQQGLDQQGLLKLVYPLLDGLDTVHQLHFLHRDIKPDNIYIRADGSPVLLDFGAARRVSADMDMTNIVSPGFAPFEQYHSKGNQGPWTDLYSLGAVMYWITTGKQPLESASRVREDSMPAAGQLANSAVFGAQLLQTIDWAMAPNEKARPQSVDELRRALRAIESIPSDLPVSRRLEENTLLLQTSTGLSSRPFNADEALRKNVIGTIMFLDLVGYSKHSVDQQVNLKTLFNELINKAIAGVEEASRILLDTGDGAVICFLGDPEEALRSALLLRDLLLQKYGEKLSMRVGLHMGPVRMLMDINKRVNVVGDGINVAQRIMDFSAANQITVSRAYFDVVSRISDGGHAMFEFLGPRLDKHGRSHYIYALVDPRGVQQAASAFAPTQQLPAMDPIAASELQRIEAELTKAIGPLAQVLVKKALRRAATAPDLRELLAPSIQDMVTRESFLHPTNSTLPSEKKSNSIAFAASAPLVRSAPGPHTLAPSQTLSAAAPTSLRQHSAPQPNSGAVAAAAGRFSEAQQTQLERALSQHIGPLAKTLVRKEMARQTQWSSLLQALAQHIDKPEDRAKFVASASKIAG